MPQYDERSHEVGRIYRWLKAQRDNRSDDSSLERFVLVLQDGREQPLLDHSVSFESALQTYAEDFYQAALDNASGYGGRPCQYHIQAFAVGMRRPVSHCPFRLTAPNESAPSATEGDQADYKVILRNQAAHIEALMRINLATITATQGYMRSALDAAEKRAASADESWFKARELHGKLLEEESNREIAALQAANKEETKKKVVDRVMMLAQHAATGMLGGSGLIKGDNKKAMQGVALIDMLKTLDPEMLKGFVLMLPNEQQAVVNEVLKDLQAEEDKAHERETKVAPNTVAAVDAAEEAEESNVSSGNFSDWRKRK